MNAQEEEQSKDLDLFFEEAEEFCIGWDKSEGAEE